MNRKFYFSFIAVALMIAATFAFVIGNKTGRASSNSALAALPASDFIISIDVQRALNETLPSLLSSNPGTLAKFNAHLEEFQQKTGINPRVFESVAIGGSLNPTLSPGRRDQSTVVIARGSFNSTELLNAGFAAAQKECEFVKEEQQYEGKTIYLISQVKPLKKSSGENSARLSQEQYSHHFEVSAASKEKFAITALDANSIAVGSPESVRAAIDASLGRNRVDEELVQLASQSTNAAISFSGKIPEGFAEKNVPNDMIGRYFASIRKFYGSFSANGSDAETFIALQTEKAEDATRISDALNSLKSLAALSFTQSTDKSSRNNSFSDLLKGVSVTAEGNEVKISVKFQPGNIGPFVRHF
ncbi:MAG TPA: hypothetical protein VF791_12925 [Pyrinomonadaceae bacterium]